MCGIAGFIDFKSKKFDDGLALAAMVSKIAHRGPDDFGYWEMDGVALGHRRLSILDLSSAGKQPMKSRSGRYIMIFNGEIYNHIELRDKFDKSFVFRGNSDTETLIELIEQFGLEKALNLSVGMFGLAIWDTHKRTVALARDRLGEKPLYYGYQNGVFLFGSELKALCAHPSFQSNINWESASTFLRLNYIPAPHSIYAGIYKLQPGTILTLTSEDLHRNAIPKSLCYWSLAETALQGDRNPFNGSINEAMDELEFLVRRSVRMQTLADVPVGAFLSGGIDSSLVVAMMQQETRTKVTTFCIGMPETNLDESSHAAAVASYLGTNHIEYFLRPKEALEIIPKLTDIWDEPFGDSSQIPTLLVSQIARRHVGVVLSGDGGDEFFLGYPHHNMLSNLWKLRTLRNLPWDFCFNSINRLSNSRNVNNYVNRAKFVVEGWNQQNPQELYRFWKDRYRSGDFPMKDECGVVLQDYPILSDSATSFGLYDAGSYLPDDILVKVDRASMANSLETRAPLLDHRIVEFAFQLKSDYKLKGRTGKHVLREVLYRNVPKNIVDRPKMGFSIPLGTWLTNDLRDWVESLLQENNQYSNHFDLVMIKKMWDSHLKGEKENTEKIWSILSLLSFLNKK